MEITTMIKDIRDRALLGMFLSATITTAIVTYSYRVEIFMAISVLFWLVIAIAILLIIGGAWYGIERLLLLRVNRLELEKSAHTMVIQNGGATFIRDTSNKASYHAMHLQAKPTLNAALPYVEPTRAEMAIFEAYNAPRQVISPQAIPLLPDNQEIELTDWMSVFSQPLQAYAIIGKQQSGKTYQAQHLAAKWVSEGIQPLVIGPKFDVGEWQGCILIGGKNDASEIERGINVVKDEAQRRYDSPDGHKTHPLLVVFFDDWSAIIAGTKELAKELIYRGSTIYASVNIILYFINHADTSPAWGVDNVGAALKDGFVKLLIAPHYDEFGRIIHDKAVGVIRFPTGEERQARLIQSPIPTPVNIATIPITIDVPTPAKLSEADEKTLALFDSGEAVISKLAQAVYGNKGKHYNGKVKRTLADNGRLASNGN
jgi:hypothetical protein